MMRDIKFRAFYIGDPLPLKPEKLELWEKPQMIYDVQDLYDGMRTSDTQGILSGFNSFGELLDYRRFIVEQYIGQRDFYNNEIYEGDIYKIRSTGEIYICVFLDGTFTGQEPNNGDFDVTPIIGMHCVVIGNIHENPEMIKGE